MFNFLTKCEKNKIKSLQPASHLPPIYLPLSSHLTPPLRKRWALVSDLRLTMQNYDIAIAVYEWKISFFL